MASESQGGIERVWPDEKLSRRPGWTDGPAVILFDGKSWHLPRLDAAMIPHLGRLQTVARAVELFRMKAIEADQTSGGIGTIYDEVFAANYKGFFALAIDLQYRIDSDDLSDLIDGGIESGRERFDGYLIDFYAFARRYPIPAEGEFPSIVN